MAKAISIIDEVLDYKTLSRIYCTNKIKYNPKDYSLKDKLLAVDLDKSFKHIAQIDQRAEGYLQDILTNEGYSRKDMNWKHTSYFMPSGITQMALGYPRTISGTPCFIKMNDMYLKPEGFIRYMCLDHNRYLIHDPRVLNKSDLKKLESSDNFNAVLQLHIALTSNNSIAKHLIWLATEFKDMPFKAIYNLDVVTDALKKKQVITIRIPLEESAMFSPVKAICTPGVPDNFIVAGTTALERIIGLCNITCTTRAKCIIYGLEVLHALYTIPNPKYIDILEQLIARNADSFEQMMFEIHGGRISPTPAVRKIIDCNNPEERYKLIHDYIEDNNVWTLAQAGVSTDVAKDLPYVSEWLLETCAFCNEYAIYDLRVKYLSILYKHCKDNGILDEHFEDTPENAADFTDDMSAAACALGTSLTALEDSTSLMDINEMHGPIDKSAPPSGPTAEVPPTVEALDKLKASYRDDKYSFDVEDVIDTNPNDTYINIAEKSALLNKSLIKRIKEIKVYNMGGKNAGMSRGKLDKKALHRYKTCKDIFYDNTYKVKESDLAFGLILDVSGSMAGNGIRNGVATMIILHETLKALNINHSIITHTSDGKYNSIINRYQSFKEDKTYNTLKNYALSSISAHNGNCDSGALFYMEKALLRVKNKDKICIMFSDGEPTECTGTDLKEQVAKMERQGIKVIGVGINYDNIKKYYSEYANGSNLNEMFDIVAGILKRYILEKED